MKESPVLRASRFWNRTKYGYRLRKGGVDFTNKDVEEFEVLNVILPPSFEEDDIVALKERYKGKEVRLVE